MQYDNQKPVQRAELVQEAGRNQRHNICIGPAVFPMEHKVLQTYLYTIAIA